MLLKSRQNQSGTTMKKCIITLYSLIDDFCKLYTEWEKANLVPSTKQRHREGQLSLSELMTVILFFYFSAYKDFKNYYMQYFCGERSNLFRLPTYSRVISLWPKIMTPLVILLHSMTGEHTGIYFIDSTKLQICHNKRTRSNRVFAKKATIGKSSYGWFMGFKLHLIINNRGQVMAIKITQGHKSDLSVASDLAKELCGKLFGDKGYISKKLFEDLYNRGLKIITGIRKDMKNHLLDVEEKIMLRKRSLIEGVFNILKNRMELEHTRSRSPLNYLIHILACIVSYSITKLNPKLNLQPILINP